MSQEQPQKQQLNNQQIPEPQQNEPQNSDHSPSSQNSPQNEPVPQRKTRWQIKSQNNPQGQQNFSSQSETNQFKFPLVNAYYSEHSKQFLQTMEWMDKVRAFREHPQSNNTYINCDVRYFNWDLFIKEVGKFDVLVIDPPWRIKGAQKNDSQFMFSNCRFSLQYNTMSNHEIKQLPLHEISDEGFIFLWILNTQLNSSLQIMQEWGYELVQDIVWTKLRNQRVYLTHGYYFMHSYQLCLVGYKNKRKDGKSMLLKHGVNPNVVFGEVRKKSQKPQDIYSLIQMVFKGKKKIQIFARNHNLRFGIFSIGNQLGEAYDKWQLHLKCDDCGEQIQIDTKRYKSKIKANYDLCEKCIEKHNPEDKQNFFQFANQVHEDVRHEYLSCDQCGVEPIWGIRFKCMICPDYDLCESCFDKYLKIKNDQENGNKMHADHEFRTLEVPVYGFGFSIHEYKCCSCYQSPIIGVSMSCTTCKNFKLCQKCFFDRPRHDKLTSSKGHKADHMFEMLFDPELNEEKKYECFACKKIIQENCYRCENCFNFFFCEYCYLNRSKFKSMYANTHKKYHVFTKQF